VAVNGFDVGPYVTEQTRVEQGRRLRNPRVRALLDSGAALLDESLSAGIDRPFRLPSGAEVCARAATDEPFAALTNPTGSARNAYARTWPTKTRFDADLIMYAMTSPSWFAGDEYADATLVELIDKEREVDEVFRQIAFNEALLFESRHFRLQLVMQALAPDTPLIRAALERMYDAITAAWVRTCEGTLAHYGLRLRRGLTVTHLAMMLTGLAEGLSLRRLAHPDDRMLLDPAQRTTLLATGVFAVFAACLQDGADDRGLAQLCRDVTNQHRPSQPSSA
jgi:hypothetical protein